LPAVHAGEVLKHLPCQASEPFAGVVQQLRLGGRVTGVDAVDPCLELGVGILRHGGSPQKGRTETASLDRLAQNLEPFYTAQIEVRQRKFEFCVAVCEVAYA